MKRIQGFAIPETVPIEVMPEDVLGGAYGEGLLREASNFALPPPPGARISPATRLSGAEGVAGGLRVLKRDHL
ncbi:MAG: hypothetical protein ACREDH_09595 [Methylocella sp.]